VPTDTMASESFQPVRKLKTLDLPFAGRFPFSLSFAPGQR